MGKTKITSGKKVYEVRPAVAWDKGKAVKLLMKDTVKVAEKASCCPYILVTI